MYQGDQRETRSFTVLRNYQKAIHISHLSIYVLSFSPLGSHLSIYVLSFSPLREFQHF